MALPGARPASGPFSSPGLRGARKAPWTSRRGPSISSSEAPLTPGFPGETLTRSGPWSRSYVRAPRSEFPAAVRAPWPGPLRAPPAQARTRAQADPAPRAPRAPYPLYGSLQPGRGDPRWLRAAAGRRARVPKQPRGGRRGLRGRGHPRTGRNKRVPGRKVGGGAPGLPRNGSGWKHAPRCRFPGPGRVSKRAHAPPALARSFFLPGVPDTETRQVGAPLESGMFIFREKGGGGRGGEGATPALARGGAERPRTAPSAPHPARWPGQSPPPSQGA